jgi:hypothetical protein
MVTKIAFERPADAPTLGPHLRYAASLDLPMVEKDCHAGEKALIVSTGPSTNNKTVLKQIKHLAKDRTVIALKEAIPFLIAKGTHVDYSVSMDPGSERQIERTPAVPGVTYCVASSCHPSLFDHLLGNECTIRVFHSACGHSEASFSPGILTQASAECGHRRFTPETVHAAVDGIFELSTLEDNKFCPVVNIIKGEIDLYLELFSSAAVMCGGFTVANRALALANYMGFEDIIMAGTDFGWRKKGGSHYGNLVSVELVDPTYMTDGGAIDGVPWFTKPDQLASAVDVARKIKAGEVSVLGDSLAIALSKHEDDFLSEVVNIQ